MTIAYLFQLLTDEKFLHGVLVGSALMFAGRVFFLKALIWWQWRAMRRLARGAGTVSGIARPPGTPPPLPPIAKLLRLDVLLRGLLSEWIGLSIRFERTVRGELGGDLGDVEAAALNLRKRTFRVLEPDDVDQLAAAPPGPPATIG